jgi:hypothetical protein
MLAGSHQLPQESISLQRNRDLHPKGKSLGLRHTQAKNDGHSNVSSIVRIA